MKMLLLEHKSIQKKKFRIAADKFDEWAKAHKVDEYVVTHYTVTGNLYRFGHHEEE